MAVYTKRDLVIAFYSSVSWENEYRALKYCVWGVDNLC